LTSTVEFKWENNKLIRRETLTADQDLVIKNWRLAVPTTADKVRNENGTYILNGREGTLALSVKTDWKTNTETFATGDSRLGKGVLGAIPVHLIFQSTDLQLRKGQKLNWEMVLELQK
jgi:hypothetical protein